MKMHYRFVPERHLSASEVRVLKAALAARRPGPGWWSYGAHVERAGVFTLATSIDGTEELCDSAVVVWCDLHAAVLAARDASNAGCGGWRIEGDDVPEAARIGPRGPNAALRRALDAWASLASVAGASGTALARAMYAELGRIWDDVRTPRRGAPRTSARGSAKRWIGRRRDGVSYRGKALAVDGYSATRCDFGNVYLWRPPTPDRPHRIARCHVTDCSFNDVHVVGLVAEDVVADGLRFGQDAICWSLLFRHVVLRGKVGTLCLRFAAAPELDPHPEQARAAMPAWAALVTEHYRAVDWGLDIREARATELELSGLPAQAVRRDPRMDAVLTRRQAEKVLALGPSSEIDSRLTLVQLAAEELLKTPWESIVLPAPRGSRRVGDELAAMTWAARRGFVTFSER